MNTSSLSLSERDNKVIWHPFTQHGLESEFLPVVRGDGAWLELSDGRKIIDVVSAWWVNLHGHAHPVIAEAIYAQALRLEHIIFAGFTHEPAIELAEILIQAAQERGTQLSRCFYTDNGSTAVEAAMKMAFQYHKNKGVTSRTRFLALNNSYHGDTLGGMGVSARGSYHQYFVELLPEVDFVPPDNIAALEQQLSQNPESYAAMIVEPLVQAAGGMLMYSPQYLVEVERLCRKYGVLLICDEVFTGFYRTGTCFALEQAGIKPDLLCLAKGLTGGFLPLAVTLSTEEVFQTFYAPEVSRAFFHSHSYNANPLGCAAALASWQLLQREETQQAIARITLRTQEWVERLAKHPQVAAVRALGTIGVVEVRGVPSYFTPFSYKVRAYAIEHGVLLRPLGPVLYTLPPYCITDAELDQVYNTIEDILNNLKRFL